MAPFIFQLIACPEPASFLARLATLQSQERPLYVGECHHWIREPSLSKDALIGKGQKVINWRFLFIYAADGPAFTASSKLLSSDIDQTWTLAAEISDEMLSGYQAGKDRRASSTPPTLPAGWSVQDSSGLKASVPPSNLELSLGCQSHRLDANKDHDKPVVLGEALGDFGSSHAKAVFMLNIISSNPGQRSRTHAYFGHFGTTVGRKYGGEGIILGAVSDWSSRSGEGELTAEEASKAAKDFGSPDGPKVGWEDVGLVYYPNVWYFAKLLDDPEYADADRKYKQGALRDCPILLCTEVDVKYE